MNWVVRTLQQLELLGFKAEPILVRGVESQTVEDALLCVWDRLELVCVHTLSLRVCVLTHGFHLVKSFFAALRFFNSDELANIFRFFSKHGVVALFQRFFARYSHLKQVKQRLECFLGDAGDVTEVARVLGVLH